MRHSAFLLAAVLAALPLAAPLAAQKFQPKSIQFQGDPDYTDQELLDATGLKTGAVFATGDVNNAAKTLMDSGVFRSVLWKFDGQDLVFQLTPAEQLCAIHLTNLPLAPGPDLDAKLHAALPLYRGRVPSDGGLSDGVRGALEHLLAAQGITASVLATVDATSKVPAVNYSIMVPPVLVGEIRLAGGSPPIEPGAQAILTKLTGSPFDVAGSSLQISTYLGNYYQDEGYLEASMSASQQAFVIAQDAIRIPFEISVIPGVQYRLAQIQLGPDLVVSQSDFDKHASLHPGDIAAGQQLTTTWQFVARQYHNHGYMEASVHPAPSFDRPKGTVSFTVSVDPGPVYTMGNLTIENVSDDLRALMLANWKMPAGSTFNESAILNFFAIGDANPTLKRIFGATNGKYSLNLDHDKRTVDVTLRLEKKA